MKRIISLLLCFLMMFSVILPSFANTDESETIEEIKLLLPNHDDYNPDEQIKAYYEMWKDGNHYNADGTKVEKPGYVQSFRLPEVVRLPGEAIGSDLGSVVVMVPNGTPDELPGEYCVSTDEAMGYGMIIAVLMDDQELFNELYRVIDYYDSFKYLDEDETEELRLDHLTSWAIAAKPGIDWFETDYFKGLTPEAQQEWRDNGVQYDPLYEVGTEIKESIIVGETNSKENLSGSAMDGELDIAYALYLAHSKWETESSSQFYLEGARNRFYAMFEYLIEEYGTHTNADGTDTLLLPVGDYFKTYEVDGVEVKSALTRPCDWMNSHIRAFYNDTGYEKALELIENTYEQSDLIENEVTGFVPDFLKWIPSTDGGKDTIVPAEDDLANEWLADHFYMNSSRYPFRQVMDYIHYGDTRGLDNAVEILDYLYEKHGFSAEEDFWSLPYAGYELDGTPQEDCMWKNPPLNAGLYTAAVASNNEKYQYFVNQGWSDLVYTFTSRFDDWGQNGLGIDPSHSGYFGDTWQLMAMLTISGEWKAPVVHTAIGTDWEVGVKYTKGDTILFDNDTYVCLQDHTALSNWIPTEVPALWAKVKPVGEVVTWDIYIQYTKGDLVEFEGKIYNCLQSHTAYYGWTPAAVPSLWNEK